MTPTLGYIKGLSRDNYFNSSAINPDLQHKMQTLDMIETSSHQYLSEEYRRYYEAGDSQAIFAYVKADVDAFDAPWVRAQMKAWRRENTLESRKKLHRLMRAYTDDRGKDQPAYTLQLIRRDQAVYKAVMVLREQGMSLEDCFVEVAERSWEPGNLSTASVRKVYKLYQDGILTIASLFIS